MISVERYVYDPPYVGIVKGGIEDLVLSPFAFITCINKTYSMPATNPAIVRPLCAKFM